MTKCFLADDKKILFYNSKSIKELLFEYYQTSAQNSLKIFYYFFIINSPCLDKVAN